jgi:hypothetical protein
MASLRPWIDLAEEIIVVDSFSSDGTVEYLQRELAGLPVQFHSRPRGLYQSWNFGIQQATRKWLYVSTVGDSITRELLTHLISLGETVSADVVMSNPHFIDEQNQPVPHMRWAIDDIITTANPLRDCALTDLAAHFFALIHTRTAALLGSSASNLYLTTHLQKHPFPTDYGTAGDGAWGMLHSFDTRFACTALSGSTFRVHAKSYSPSDYHVDGLSDRLHEVGLEVNRQQQNRPDVQSLNIPELLLLQVSKVTLYAELKKMRKASRLWILNPTIWAARKTYKRTRKRFDQLLTANLSLIRAEHLKKVDVVATQREPPRTFS